MKTSNKLTAILIGAAAGAIVGALLTTDKGAEITKKISESAGKLVDSLMNKAKDGLQTASEYTDDASDKVHDMVEKARKKAEQFS